MTNQQHLTIAFSAVGGNSWIGGLNYLQNIVVALNSLDESERPCLKMIAHAGSEEGMFSSILPLLDETILVPNGKGAISTRLLNRLRKNKRDVVLGPLLREQRVDCLFSMGNYGHGFSIPLLSWLPDFQHLHLTEMFSSEEIEERNQSYAETARLATRIIVTSEDVKSDFHRFAPEQTDKVRVISGVSQVPAEIYDTDPKWVCQEYGLPEKFFYLPNQFWKHKNHEIVLDALASLQATNPEISVVCTGHTHDERHPRHFTQLLTRIAQQDLRNKFIILGMVPQTHTFQLIRQSLAVLQPSRFEGWSNTVAEAKSVGKPIILSDLPVHCEHNPPGAIFFDPHDTSELANAMQTISDNGKPGPNREMEEAARENLRPRTLRFGREFMAIAHEAVS